MLGVYTNCTHCDLEFSYDSFSEGLLHRHEEECAFNPTNKACESCKNFHVGDELESCLKNEDIFCGTKRNCEKWESELISS